MEGYRVMCDECRNTKQPLTASSSKSNNKRVLNDFKKKNQNKRKKKAKESKSSIEDVDELTCATINDEPYEEALENVEANDASESNLTIEVEPCEEALENF